MLVDPRCRRWQWRDLGRRLRGNQKGESAKQQPTEWQRIGNQIDATLVFARSHFINVHKDANSMMDNIDPGQPFLRVNILRWREIFRMIETPSSNVDLIGAFVVLIGQRRSTATTKRPPRSRLRPIFAWPSFHELELRTFYYDPGYCLSSGGSPAVCTMTIRPATDLGRRAETHLATITATGILFFSMLVTACLACLIETAQSFGGRIS